MERTREYQIEVANTIMEQLGGYKFLVMTGAKNMMAIGHNGNPGLNFQIPGAKNRINRVRIILEPSDTYNVSFWNFRTGKTKKVAEHTMIYDDMLRDIFTAETGLDTHL